MSAEVRTTPGPRLSDAEESAGYVQISLSHTSQPEASTARNTGHTAPRDKGPEERARLRDLWEKSRSEAERLWSGAKSDREAMYGSAMKLSGFLDRLWDLRRQRDSNWVGILDQARTALGGLLANEGGIELATEDQCWKLLQLIEDYLSPASKEIGDLQKAVKLVVGMGLDPYSGLEPLSGE